MANSRYLAAHLTPEDHPAAKPPPTIYTVPDAAAHLGRGQNTIAEQAARIGVGFRSVGGTMLFAPADVAALKAHRPRPGPKPKAAPGLAGVGSVPAPAPAAPRTRPRKP